MKKSMYFAAIAAIVAGSLVTSCESNTTRVENAEEKVIEAKEDLKEAQKELSKEYPAFRIEAEAKIDANDKRIAELSAIVNKPGDKLFDDMRRKRIEELKQKNADLRNRLYNYEKEQSDWEVFKREFNRDLDGIVEAFKDLGKNNSN
jgi:predicted nucleotide-binding protein (sugar kinase/HSP70/actin superfamily)